jgi:uncharacterized OsmC-like protein
MAGTQVREALERTSKLLIEHPEKALVKNALATASLMDGLKCRVSGPAGETIQTDMPGGVGGNASGPNPGWLMRAGLASCNATCIAMRAAQLGIELSALDVTVTSQSDSRGMLGLADVSAGLQDLHVHVRISAAGKSPAELDELVRWACAHSPVGCSDPASARVEVQVE